MHSSFPRTSRLSGIVRTAAVAFLTSCAAAALAQQGAANPNTPTLDLSHPALNLQAALHSPADLVTGNEASAGSSSSSSLIADLPADPSASSSDLQPPPRRRRYGRPNYSDKYRNSDGSNRLAFVVGGGFNSPVGSASSNYLNLGYRFEGGAGINLNKKFGILAQFDYDHFGIPGNVLANQANLYNTLDTYDPPGTDAYTGLGGSSHIWSFTLNPTYNIYQSDSLGAYVVAGGGFYHKVTNFTVPVVETGYDYFGYPYQYQANQTIDHYTSNAPGVTGGVGMTYKFSRWSNERLFAEARFVHTFNQARLADATVTNASTGTPYNLYPPNSNETSWIPITFGLRF